MNKRFFIGFILMMISLGGCNQNVEKDKIPALNLAYLDISTAPGNDFYQYATGGWQRMNPLEAEYASFSSFEKLREDNRRQIKALIEEISVITHPKGSIDYKINLMYSMGLDSVQRNSMGAEPIKEQLNQIYSISTKADFAKMVARMHRSGIYPFFTIYVDTDEKDNNSNIVKMYQAGIGMSDRDYYLATDANTIALREAYKTLITNLFILSGSTPEKSKRATDAVIKVETEIAKASYTREDLRDPQKNYNKQKFSELVLVSKELLDWDSYLNVMGLTSTTDVDVKQLNVYKSLNNTLSKITLEEQKYYLAFNLLKEASSFLSDDFVKVRFDFYGKTVSGKQEQEARWKNSLNVVNSMMGEAIGQRYVEKYFPSSAKEKMVELVKNLQVAFGERINSSQWMSDQTKAKAQEKLNAFNVKIGYPDKWRDYTSLEFENDSYWANIQRTKIFEIDEMFARLNKPVDKSRWLMNPQTINAYYNFATNEICFPAAILQPPFFNPNADDAVNYGAIGILIGHEMTHGFDDQGRHYDKYGNLADWWTEEDSRLFTERANILVEQYNQIVVVDTVHANGIFTLGENIADQGGVLISYQAYKNSLKGKSAPEPIDQFTDDQRFFLSCAAICAQNIRTEEILHLTRLDVHSLGKWRVNANLRNIDAFFAAFDIKEGDPMYRAPEERVNIW